MSKSIQLSRKATRDFDGFAVPAIWRCVFHCNGGAESLTALNHERE